jgi:hypothetical protein
MCCFLAVSLISIGEASHIASDDRQGMNTQEYYLYDNIHLSDLIVRGTLYNTKSFLNNGAIETSSEINIKEILKQENISNITNGMTIEGYVQGGTVGNITACIEGEGCPRTDPGPYEGIYFLRKWDLSGKGRYYLLDSSHLSIDSINQAISNAEKGSPIKLPDMSLAAQLEREREKKGVVTESLSPIITNLSQDNASAGTKTQVSIFGSGFGVKSTINSSAEVVFYSGLPNAIEYYASGR